MDLQTAIDLGATTNQRVVLRRRPEGLLSKDDVELEDGVALPDLADGEALIEVEWLGVDATVRTWLSKAEGYLPAVEIGEPVRASGIGRVVATRCETFPSATSCTGSPGGSATASCGTTRSPRTWVPRSTPPPCCRCTAPPA